MEKVKVAKHKMYIAPKCEIDDEDKKIFKKLYHVKILENHALHRLCHNSI